MRHCWQCGASCTTWPDGWAKAACLSWRPEVDLQVLATVAEPTRPAGRNESAMNYGRLVSLTPEPMLPRTLSSYEWKGNPAEDPDVRSNSSRADASPEL